MDVLWLNDETAHVETRQRDNADASWPKCLTWHRMESDDDSHMARTRSALIVLTETEGQYWVSMVFQDEARRIEADQEVHDVHSLDEALVQATQWALEKVAKFQAGS